MLRARGTWDADEFVEGIVDDQARNYTKRVLGSFFTYTLAVRARGAGDPQHDPQGAATEEVRSRPDDRGQSPYGFLGRKIDELMTSMLVQPPL